MKFNNVSQYIEKYGTGLEDGFYEYYVGDTAYNLYTQFTQDSGWIKVVKICNDSRDHLTADRVRKIKPSDDVINYLMTTTWDYNIRAQADSFNGSNSNKWLQYPHVMYVHNSIEKFASETRAREIKNSNAVSLNDHDSPIMIAQDSDTMAFGNGNNGDTFYGYGSRHDFSKGFFQSFSGDGEGSVWVR